MAKRIRVRRFLSTQIQGDGSWVKVLPVTVAEIRANRERASEAARVHGNWLRAVRAANKKGDAAPEPPKTIDAFELGLDIIKSHVVEWDWVDDDGNPLPQMPEHPEVVELLTDPEVTFLSNCIQGNEEAAKN